MKMVVRIKCEIGIDNTLAISASVMHKLAS